MKNKFLDIYFNQSKEQEQTIVLEKTKNAHKLIIWNDDFNTFDFVIDCLIGICGHNPIQAEQCTMLIHYKGKCTVKSGDLEVLKPMHKKLISKGLTSEIF